eukprot:CAMPEP_0195520884 /NCGR_PEP_ID=MMETSP0794_2-20130614/17597_1 /TAXON_ID=515487 /ORGANISM="Stephanopyxis turris, Strain CCMP 815" /LENGTH=292 /DNA_ID=CAMNT_0040650319 /DNA_START=275 /DNA_END=1153 /DNA_ORIENTATION=-
MMNDGGISRRSILSKLTTSLIGGSFATQAAYAAEEDDNVENESIIARAARLSRAVEEKEATQVVVSSSPSSKSTQTAYDFEIPVDGKLVSFGDLVRQEDITVDDKVKKKVKAILVVNIKQDDPIARKNIPELISLAARYGKQGEFSVVCIPTDQGYYEPDTSKLIRLKMKSEYGYGINPATALTDKLNLLGNSADPFARWLQSNCRSPAGLGRIQGNFEKFLVDGQTGRPLRRYPRKYMPYDIADDIDALMKGKPLPPPGADYMEEWRGAAYEGERDTYRFQKGLNYFDKDY